MITAEDRPVIQIDIVSDVVCPWCIVGFKQLEKALAQSGAIARLRWHPFELNPDMGPEGQNLREHIMEKYGSTAEQSQQARDRLAELGAELGFTFNFNEESRIVNTFKAHQLLDWAEGDGQQHALKMALFNAYFTDQKDVSELTILIATAQAAGLNSQAAQDALESGGHKARVREKQRFWSSRGISGVPAMVFGGKYLMTGAQGVENYGRIIQRCLTEAA